MNNFEESTFLRDLYAAKLVVEISQFMTDYNPSGQGFTKLTENENFTVPKCKPICFCEILNSPTGRVCFCAPQICHNAFLALILHVCKFIQEKTVYQQFNEEFSHFQISLQDDCTVNPIKSALNSLGFCNPHHFQYWLKGVNFIVSVCRRNPKIVVVTYRHEHFNSECFGSSVPSTIKQCLE